MKIHSKTHSARRGSAVALALVCVTVVAGFAVAFLRISTSATRRQVSEVENLRAFYVAEAGLAEAFQALRVGRSGQIGSETAPAAFGNGLLWVDAVESAEGQVQLESTALVGTGRATLALVVEPVDIPLGFFSDEDLVVDNVLMVDGFNSDERTYVEELDAISVLQAYAQSLLERCTQSTLTKELGLNNPASVEKIASDCSLDTAETAELEHVWPDLVDAYEAEMLFPEPVLSDPTPIYDRPIDTDVYQGGVLTMAQVAGTQELPIDADPIVTEPLPAAPALPSQHTSSGGMLGSNGNVQFNLSGDDQVAIYGDVVPGPNGTVEGLTNVSINGETQPRSDAVDLPSVEVPVIALDPPRRHADLLPLVVSPGESGFQRIEVAPGAELILRGPATVVIGELVLESGATLTLDTRNGDIALFVTGGLDLQSGSITATTSDFADELTVQVAGIASDAGGAPVKLDSTSQFHGTIYSPETEVYVGSDFEVYGGIVARKLAIGPGAKLHFDNSGFEGTPIPRLVSWRIVEIKNAARSRDRNLFRALSINAAAAPSLAEAHDLAAVYLKIEYINLSGVSTTYAGTEDGFDWNQVQDVIAVSRVATRDLEDCSTTPTTDTPIEPEPTEPEPTEPDGTRTEVVDIVAGYPMTMNAKDLVDLLIPTVPLSDAEWFLINLTGLAGGQRSRLVDADVAAGGTGGH